ncbi:50S ribosomal protein L2 [Candidatus Woesearchaeota archaeon]|nr:50S ribosomal protein L2 [Candidatus Woesearchaeota archaeon]MBW3017922.1 50S ribosomal protein L2 [Candidatus Woesearchaeota archaeon]
MGKQIIAQQRGRSPKFWVRGFRHRGPAKHNPLTEQAVKGIVKGTIMDIVHCPGHSAPLAKVQFDDRTPTFILAPEGIKIGDILESGINIAQSPGAITTLELLPEGTLIHNIEIQPGDGGKLVRSSGAFAKILSKTPEGILIQLPSKKKKIFNPMCRASIGTVAGGGRKEKPLLKAGNKFKAFKARNKLYPKVCGQSMNAVDHPHGGTRSSKKNYPYSVSRHAPPGAKVGQIASRRTGRKK